MHSRRHQAARNQALTPAVVHGVLWISHAVAVEVLRRAIPPLQVVPLRALLQAHPACVSVADSLLLSLP